MMIVERLINKPVSSNTYVLHEPDSHACIVVDPGSKEIEELTTFLSRKNLKPEYIFLTHEHFDHIWGCNALVKRYGSKIICSETCKEKISVPQNYYNKLYYDDDTFYSIECVYATIEKLGRSFLFQSSCFHFLKTPGHSSSSICIESAMGLFTGDTLMNGYKPVILKRHEGSKELFGKSIQLLFDKYPSETTIFPGHGVPFKLREVYEFYKPYI